MYKIALILLLLSSSALAREPQMTGDLCRDTMGIRAALVLAKITHTPFDIALRSWKGHEPGMAKLVNELDDKEIYEVVINTGRARYRMDMMRLYECNTSLVWMEKLD